jgi:tRNA (guanine-N7-)-methyltransferase
MDLARGKTLDPGAYGFDIEQLPPFDTGAFSPSALFPNPQLPLEIEIGSGKGTFLVQQAAIQRDTNFLGIEWATEFWRYAADRARRHALANVRLLRADATQFLKHWVPDACTRTIHLYFSDPWPKTRHHKRRVVQDATLVEFHRVLAPHGELRIVTDHDALWKWDLEHAERHAALFSRGPFTAPPSALPGELVGSNFERKFAREGRPFNAMTLTKRSAP